MKEDIFHSGVKAGSNDLPAQSKTATLLASSDRESIKLYQN
jgi:hypothetical protein